jgi:hypothetical protein
MERFANTGRNGHFQHSYLIVFEENLVMLWRRGESVVLRCPPLIKVTCTTFPPSPDGGRWRVSNGGGVMPRWRRDGKELFYISPDSQMMAVD